MELKPGYKQTEAGVIPIDWIERRIGDLHPFVTSGSRGWAAYYSDSGDPFIRITNLTRSSIYLCLDDLRFVKIPEGDSEGVRTQLQNGDVLISITADIGIIGFVSKDIPQPAYINQHIALIRFDELAVCPQFVSYFLASERPQRIFRALTDSGAKAGMNLSTVQQVGLSLPPTVVEQEAIAEALSDADALIESLEQLLVKKRQIKQGAMQELLTGKERLPGFTSKWKQKLFGEIAQLRKQRIDPRRAESSQFCIELEHIEQGTGFLGGYTATGEESSLKSVFQKDDVLFGKLRAYLRKYWLADRTGVCSTEIWVLMANAASLIPPYLFQLVRTDRFIEAASTAYGTHMPRSDWKVVKDFELLIPPPEEQTVIADVLSDMDAEIAAVETKLTKARQIKQGMMQELLTGRIRLVRPSAQILSFPAKESASATDTSHNTHFNEAVVIAVLSSTFGSEKFPLGRFRRTKFSYLLHRHAEQVAAGFLKKAAGPYNPRTRYGGAEKIAVQNRYVRVVSTGKSEGFVADENIAQAEGYFEKWYGAEALTWLEQFRYQKNDALELLTTVDMACEDLSKAGKVVATSTVKQIIQDSPEWKAKLNRSVFSDDNIAATIETCRQLFSR
jgi:type I restriction enzyme S subunit